MMTSGPVSYQSTLDDLAREILEYAEVYTRKDLPEILEDQANKLSCFGFSDDAQGLFQESSLTAPSAEYLTALPAELGYHIRRGKTKDGVTRPLFTEGYQLLTYKRGARKGQYRKNKRGEILHKIIGVEGEMNRRIRARLYQAAGWLSNALPRYAGSAARNAGQQPNRAVVALVLTGERLSISITNTSAAALEVAERTGYLAQALANRAHDLFVYTSRKRREREEEFNAKKMPAPH